MAFIAHINFVLFYQVTLYGDAAPRRPRLHTARVYYRQYNSSQLSSPSAGAADSSATGSLLGVEDGRSGEHGEGAATEADQLGGLSRDEIAADMRSIAGGICYAWIVM